MKTRGPTRSVRERHGVAPVQRQGTDSDMYVRLNGRMHRVAELVMSAFGPPRPSPEHAIGFLDGDRTNRAADNLHWVPA